MFTFVVFFLSKIVLSRKFPQLYGSLEVKCVDFSKIDQFLGVPHRPGSSRVLQVFDWKTPTLSKILNNSKNGGVRRRRFLHTVIINSTLL